MAFQKYELENARRKKVRLPAAEVAADQLVQEVEEACAETEDDIREDVEHHLLKNASSILRINQKKETNLKKIFLVNWKTLQTIRHHHKQDGRRTVN